MTTATTIQGDTWDILALRLLGSEVFVDKLLQANPSLRDVAIFSAGQTINVPDLPAQSDDTSPLWRRSGTTGGTLQAAANDGAFEAELRQMNEALDALKEWMNASIRQAVDSGIAEAPLVRLTGNQVIEGVKTFVETIVGSITGNAGTADKLKTARKINGTDFDGTADITTAKWGTARNVSISDADGTNTGSAVSVDGSEAETLKLPATIKANLSGTATKAVADGLGQNIVETYATKDYVDGSISAIPPVDTEGLEGDAKAAAEKEAAKQLKEYEKKLKAMHLPTYIDGSAVKSTFYVSKDYSCDYTVGDDKVTLKALSYDSATSSYKLKSFIYDISYDASHNATLSLTIGSSTDEWPVPYSESEVEIEDITYTVTRDATTHKITKLTAYAQDKENSLYGRYSLFPWKSIAFATSTLCSEYNINVKSVYVNVAGGTYTETVSLPLQQRTTGSITIRPASDSDTVTIERTVTGSQNAVDHTGGLWYLEDLNLSLVIGEQASSAPSYPHLVKSSDSTGSVTIRHCNLSFVDNSVPAVAGSKGNVYARLIDADSGMINIVNRSLNIDGTSDPDPAQYETTWSGTRGNASITWIYLENSSTLQMMRAGSSAPRGHGYNVSGTFTIFACVLAKSLYRHNGTGADPFWNKVNSPTGQQYKLMTGGTIATSLSSVAAVATYFPGDTEGTDEEETGSWISPNNHHPVYLAGEQNISGPKTYAQGPYGTVKALSNSAINLANGSVFTKTITANTTFSITGAPAGKTATFHLILTNGGSKTVTWPASVKWAGSTPPSLSASGVDVLDFVSPDGGTTWYGYALLLGATA